MQTNSDQPASTVEANDSLTASDKTVVCKELFCRILHESLLRRSEFWRTAKTDAHGINTAVYVCLAEICSALNDVEAHGYARPITPDRNYEKLYGLVEAYLCTPNTTPAVKDAYDNLVAWFVRNKRPDGSEPLPVSPEQEM